MGRIYKALHSSANSLNQISTKSVYLGRESNGKVRTGRTLNPRTNEISTPEENLLYAVLERAIMDLQAGYQASRKPLGRDRISKDCALSKKSLENAIHAQSEKLANRRDAIKWISSLGDQPKDACFITYSYVCDALGLDENKVRRLILSAFGDD